MLKVLLLNPYLTTNEDNRLFPIEPLGLLYLATYANREKEKHSLDITVRILDAQLEGLEKTIKTKRGYRSGIDDRELVDKLVRWQPDVIGISNNYTCHTGDVVEITELVKRVSPRSIIVVGGAHATIGHDDLVRNHNVDIVVRGEGEVTFWMLLLALYEHRNFDEIKGITLKVGTRVRVNPDRPLIKDLDALPIPDRTLIPYERYLKKDNYYTTMNRPVGTVFTSRGCPYQCVFCSTQKVWSNKWRARSPKNILREILYLTKNYGVKEICFQDDQFLGKNRELSNYVK